MENVKLENICSIGMELFRKNNDTFMRSKLSTVANRIYKAANLEFKIENSEDVTYMKSGFLPGKVYYLYSDELSEKAPEKLYDIVTFNGEICIWFYSNNILDMIDKNPINTIMSIYACLIETFATKIVSDWELSTLNNTMSIILLEFIYITYGILDLDECYNELISILSLFYTKESIHRYIDHILDNHENKTYFTMREYIDSYLELEPII